MGARIAIVAALVTGLVVAAAAHARDVPTVAPFSGTLQKIYESGVIRIGHRVNSPPFAFVGPDGKAIGYSLDLCEVVVEEIALELHKDVRVEYVPVTPEDRFDRVRSGAVDLECGSTTTSAERRAIVAFSPTVFVTGAKLLVKRGSGIRSIRDLKGKTVVLTRRHRACRCDTEAGRAAEAAISTSSTPPTTTSRSRSLASGKADAFINDDIQLYGMIAATRRGAGLPRGRRLPYVCRLCADDRARTTLTSRDRRTRVRPAGRSSEIRAIYRKWFQSPLPSGVRLDLSR